jgi:hypothetical protein
VPDLKRYRVSMESERCFNYLVIAANQTAQ